MIYLNSIIGNSSYNSGVVQIDIPKPMEYCEKKRKQKLSQGEKKFQKGVELVTSVAGGIAGIAGGAGGIAVGTVAGYNAGRVLTDFYFDNRLESYYVPTKFGFTGLRVFCTDDITTTLGNEWGSIFPSLGTLTQFSQLGNNGNIASWLAGTKAAWKGCKPLTLPLTFYIFSLSEGYNALAPVSVLLEFASVDYGDGGGITGAISEMFGGMDLGVTVHGGYKVQGFEDNTGYIQKSVNKEQNENSTFRIHLGESIMIDNLLLGDIQVTHSNIYVGSGIPLYVKVQANFRTVGVPTVYDIKRWYGF